MLSFVAFLIMFMSDVCLAEAASELPGVASAFQSWPEFGKLIAFVVGLQIIIRGLAEGLTRFSDYTDTKLDNKAAAILSEVSWFLGTLLGKVGYGTPKLVLEEAAKSANPQEKTVAVAETPKA